MFAKDPSPYEIYNDLDSEVYTFFKVLRNTPNALREQLRYTPLSRQLVAEYNDDNLNSLGEIERAARFYLLALSSFAGKLGGFPVRSGFRRDKQTRTISHGQYSKRKIDNLDQFAERLRAVIIENLDFAELIGRYDWDEALFYCDPPYLDKQHYGITFNYKQHVKLSKVLAAIEGKVILSYYPHPDLDTLYPRSYWHYSSREVVKQAGKGKHEKESKATELLIMNYNPKEDKWRGREQSSMEAFM